VQQRVETKHFGQKNQTSSDLSQVIEVIHNSMEESSIELAQFKILDKSQEQAPYLTVNPLYKRYTLILDLDETLGTSNSDDSLIVIENSHSLEFVFHKRPYLD